MDGTRFASACRPVEPPAGLDDRVLERIEGLRAETAPVRMGAAMGMRFRPAPARISRRALVGVGATALAGAGLLGFALPRMLGEGDGDAASRMAGGSRGPRDFGLQVAYADDGSSGTVFELEPTAEGLVPVEAGLGTKLRMNFSARGDGIESLTYRISETPRHRVEYGGGTVEEIPAVRFIEAVRHLSPFVFEAPDVSFASQEEAMAWAESQTYADMMWGGAEVSDTELSIDYDAGIVTYSPAPEDSGEPSEPFDEFAVSAERHATGADGVSERGNPYLLTVSIVDRDDFYGSGDEILSLLGAYWRAVEEYSAWCVEHGEVALSSLAILDPEGRALQQTYFEAQSAVSGAIGELRSASAEDFVAWMRDCYRVALGLSADILEQTVLTVEAAFEDGAAAERAYRIVRADGFEDAVADRFDAMFDYNGYTIVLGEGVFDKVEQYTPLSIEGAPLWDFVSGEPDPDAEDERLRRPLFAIEDITETCLADEA